MATKVKGGVSKVIESFERLPLDDKEYVLDIAQRQLVEAKRDKILRKAKEARENHTKGLLKKGTARDLSRDLERN